MAQRILVGRFGAPHGVRGELRLQSFTQEPQAISGYGPLHAGDGRSFVVTVVRPLKGDMLVVRVAGIADRTAAEALTGLDLTIDRSALPQVEADEVYVADLIGLAAVDEAGRAFGTVVDVPNYGGGDLIEIRPPAGGDTLLFPFTMAVVPTIDVANGRIIIVPPAEVADDGPSDPHKD